jgi:hypothetical protein
VSKDITNILSGWDYDPSRVSARWVKGADGGTKIQLRLDLGLFQMEPEGRPDGSRPRGYPTLLDYYLTLERTSRGTTFPPLEDEACAELQQEAVQFYYRYLSLYALRHYEGVIRDTRHNMQIVELVERHAPDEDMAWEFLQFYPYIRMMNARATADQFVADGRDEYEMAIFAIEQGLADIQAFWKKHDDEEYDEEITTDEEEALVELINDLRKRKPKSPSERLREDLQRAIAVENYEKAATLRDALRRMDKKEIKPVRQDVG